MIGKIRPIFDGRVSSKRPVNQSQALIIGELQTSRWRTHPIGQKPSPNRENYYLKPAIHCSTKDGGKNRQIFKSISLFSQEI